MVGSDLGVRQLPLARRQALVECRLRERGDTNGERLTRLRSLLTKVRKYTIGELGARMPQGESWDEVDELVFLTSTALAHKIIHIKFERSSGKRICRHHPRGEDFPLAHRRGQGTVEGGFSAGDGLSSTVPDKVGTLQIAAKCQLEFFAADGVPDTVPEEAFRA